MTVGTSYLYVGLVPIEYINPLTYFSDFFEKVKSSKKAITLEQNRSKNIFYEYGMQHSPEWKALIELDQLDNEETRHEMIFKIARSFGVEAQCKKHNIQYVRKDSSTYDEGDYYEWKFKSL